MKRAVQDVGASVRARLLQRARAEGIDFQLLLTRYVFERFLYRLSVSQYRDRFVLKGALLLSMWAGDHFRPTRDIDFLGYGDTSPNVLAEVIRTICAEPVADDGVVFSQKDIEAVLIREETEYGGVRIRTIASVSNARIPVQVDVGYGDAITPAPVEIKYPTLLEFAAARLKAYPIETIVAEKFESVVILGMANSRMKDYYGLYLILQTFSFKLNSLREAISRTFQRRGTMLPEAVPVGLTDKFATERQSRWRGFLELNHIAPVSPNFALVVADILNFLMPLLHTADLDLTWHRGGPWLP